MRKSKKVKSENFTSLVDKVLLMSVDGEATARRIARSPWPTCPVLVRRSPVVVTIRDDNGGGGECNKAACAVEMSVFF